MRISQHINIQEAKMLKRLIVVAVMTMLVLGVQAGRASANVVANGGFETNDFTGWTQSGNTDFTFVVDTSSHSGTHEAQLGPSGSLGFISQAIATTPGQSYMVSFWLANDLPGTNEFEALWNTVLQTPHLVNTSALDYTPYQYTATASGASTLITFGFRNDDSTFHLDDVSAAPVPELPAVWLLASGLIGLVGIRRGMQK
jgi:hypothetical protein